MHPQLSLALSLARQQDAERGLREHADLGSSEPTHRRLGRYFSHGGKADEQTVRRTGGSARGAGARLA